MRGSVEIRYPARAQQPVCLLVSNFNRVEDQCAGAADDRGLRDNMALGCRSKVASIDFDSYREHVRKIDSPTRVYTRRRFCQHHADTPMQQAHRLSRAVCNRHSELNLIGVDGNNFDFERFCGRVGNHRAERFDAVDDAGGHEEWLVSVLCYLPS
jgi:hypothetical protein